jgi:hypothetical protein
MNKRKAFFLTAVIMIMFLLIVLMLGLLKAMIPLGLIVGVLAMVGLYRSFVFLLGWISERKEADLDPVRIVGETETEAEPAADAPIDLYTYDQIREEMGGDQA